MQPQLVVREVKPVVLHSLVNRLHLKEKVPKIWETLHVVLKQIILINIIINQIHILGKTRDISNGNGRSHPRGQPRQNSGT